MLSRLYIPICLPPAQLFFQISIAIIQIDAAELLTQETISYIIIYDAKRLSELSLVQPTRCYKK